LDTLSSEHGIDTGIDIRLFFNFFIALVLVLESEIKNIKNIAIVYSEKLHTTSK